MKNFGRLLIVVLVLVGLSGVVSAEEFRTDKPIPVSFQVPEGYKVVKGMDLNQDIEKEYHQGYRIGDIVVSISVKPLEEWVRKIHSDVDPLNYTYDHYGAEEEKRTVDIFYKSKPESGCDTRFVTLNTGHRARLRTYFSDDTYQSIILEALHRGYTIEFSIRKTAPMTYEDKKLANQILMSLDF